MLSYYELLTAAMAEPLGGGKGDTTGEDGVWQGLLCHLQGSHCAWTDILLDGPLLGTWDWNTRNCSGKGSRESL